MWESAIFNSTTPSPDTRFARSGSTPPVQEGSLLAVLLPRLVQIIKHAFLPFNPSKNPLLDRRGGSRPSEASVWRRGGGCVCKNPVILSAAKEPLNPSTPSNTQSNLPFVGWLMIDVGLQSSWILSFPSCQQYCSG